MARSARRPAEQGSGAKRPANPLRAVKRVYFIGAGLSAGMHYPVGWNLPAAVVMRLLRNFGSVFACDLDATKHFLQWEFGCGNRRLASEIEAALDRAGIR